MNNHQCIYCRSKKITVVKHQISAKLSYYVKCLNCDARGPLIEKRELAELYFDLRGGIPTSIKMQVVLDDGDYSFNIAAKNFKERAPHIDEYEYKEMANEIIIDFRNELSDKAYPKEAPHGLKKLVP